MALPLSLQPYRRSLPFLVVFVIAASAVTLVVSLSAMPQYATSLSIGVNRIHLQETSQYQYDGYYAIQASDLFSQTVLSWFLTPSVLLEVYGAANLDPAIVSASELIGRFRARKYSAQNIVVQFSESSHDRAAALADGISTVVRDRGAKANQTPEGEALFEVAPAAPVIVETKPNALLNTLVALVGSLLIGGALIAGVRYLRV